MKRLLFPVTLLIILIFLAAGCSNPASTTPAQTSPPTVSATPSTAPSPSTQPTPVVKTETPTPPGSSQPKSGGTLKVIVNTLPSSIGHWPSMTADGQQRASMWAERLLDVDIKGDLVPCLAESWKIDNAAMNITFNLRKGVKFHDGTDFNAQAVKWNFDEAIASKTLADFKYIKSVEVVDDHTIKFNLSEPNSHIVYDIWRLWLFSPTACQKNGKEWASAHPVSTAAFKVVDFQRDVMIKMERYEGYWRPGRPYLDGVELRLVKDPATASAMIQAGQADMWVQATAQEVADLRDKGFDTLMATSTFNIIAPDSANPNSPFAKKEVREAVEYALDRPAMAKALGYGFWNPLDQLAPKSTSGYNPDFPVRTYDPVKAKLLLGGAGYPDGFKTTLTLLPNAQNLGVVIKNYLSAIGINADLNIVDTGRYYAIQFTEGWQGLFLTVAAISPEYCVAWLHHFGRAPDVKFASLGKSPEFLALCDANYRAKDIESMRAQTREMVTQASLDAMVIPINTNPVLTVKQKNVNTTYTTVLYWTGWRIGDDWLGSK